MRSRSLLAVLPLLACVAVGQASPTELARKLLSKESADRIRAANELGKLGPAAAPATNALAAALGDPVPEVANAAADALGKIGKAAVGPVGKALADRDRMAAGARAAGHLGALAADLVPALIKCLRVEGVGVSDPVVQAITDIGEPGLPHVIAGLADNAINVRLCDAVRRMGPIAKPAVPALIELLGKHGVRGGEGAADALGAIGDPTAVPALVALVDHSLPKVSVMFDAKAGRALAALARLKARPDLVVPVCLRVLGSDRHDPAIGQLHQHALEALERFDARQPEVLAALAAFVASNPAQNKAAAERLLKKLGG